MDKFIIDLKDSLEFHGSIQSSMHLPTSKDSAVYLAHVIIDGREYTVSVVPTDLSVEEQS